MKSPQVMLSVVLMSVCSVALAQSDARKPAALSDAHMSVDKPAPSEAQNRSTR